MNYSEALKKLNTAKEWNDYHYSKYGSFRVQLFLGRPNKWQNYEPINHPRQTDDFPNHRERLIDEVIIDFDGKKPDSETHGYAGYQRFKDRNLECSLWESGGDGMHLHCFFPELKNLSKPDREEMIQVIKKTILVGLLRPAGLNSHVCQAKPTLYQTECCRHRKGGYKNLVAKHTTDSWNRIPKDCWTNFKIIKHKRIKQAKATKELDNKYANGTKPYFIKYFESESYYKLDEGKKRVAFIIASYYGKQQPNREYILSKLRQWGSYTLRNNIKDELLVNVTNSVMKYHQEGEGIRLPYKYARDLLEEIGREDIWQITLSEETKKNDFRPRGK